MLSYIESSDKLREEKKKKKGGNQAPYGQQT